MMKKQPRLWFTLFLQYGLTEFLVRDPYKRLRMRKIIFNKKKTGCGN